MKKILKKEVIIAFILGLILSFSVTAYAYSYFANQVSYTKPGTTTEINVETALNDLYAKSTPALLWTNSTPTSSFAAQTIELDLSEYQYVAVVIRTVTDQDIMPRACGIFKISDNDSIPYPPRVGYSGGSGTREIYATSTGVTISNCTFSGGAVDNTCGIPLYIYGIKNNLGIQIED